MAAPIRSAAGAVPHTEVPIGAVPVISAILQGLDGAQSLRPQERRASTARGNARGNALTIPSRVELRGVPLEDSAVCPDERSDALFGYVYGGTSSSLVLCGDGNCPADFIVRRVVLLRLRFLDLRGRAPLSPPGDPLRRPPSKHGEVTMVLLAPLEVEGVGAQSKTSALGARVTTSSVLAALAVSTVRARRRDALSRASRCVTRPAKRPHFFLFDLL